MQPGGSGRTAVKRPAGARRKRPPTGPSRSYVAVWAALAALSLGYVTVLTVNPELLTAMGVPMAPVEPEGNYGQRFVASTQLAADVQSLQQTVAGLQSEVAAMKTTAPLSVRNPVVPVQRPVDAKSVDAKPGEPKLQGRIGADGARVAGMVIVNGQPQTQLPASPAAPASIAGSVVTGSIARAPETAAPAGSAIGPHAGTVGLELVTGPSVDALRLNWILLNERHGAALKGLEPRYLQPDQNGAFRLLAGPVATADAADSLCEQFRSKGTQCHVTTFQGNAF
jgi:hypothetical protein